jgi:hypothetical protein
MEELGANILATEGSTKKHKNPTMNIIIKSRREFIKKSGVIIAAASAFGTVGHLSATEKKEEEVSPPEGLMREHGVLKRILLVYGEALRRMDANEDLPRKTGREFSLPAFFRLNISLVSLDDELSSCALVRLFRSLPRAHPLASSMSLGSRRLHSRPRLSS